MTWCSFFPTRATYYSEGRYNRLPTEQDTSFLTQVNQNIGIVHRVCRTYLPHDPVEREDAFQDVMYQLWKSFSQFKGESKFSTWMYRVALNTVLTRIRNRDPRREELTEGVALMPDLSERSNQEQEVRRLYEAIGTLSDIDKAIIVLHLDDHDYDEIASITGITKNNVSVRLVRIKRALKNCLQGTP